MKKVIGILIVALFLSSCSVGTIRTDNVKGTGSIYYCSGGTYTLENVKTLFPKAVLITTYNRGWMIYTSE
jgi:hypothetical protein